MATLVLLLLLLTSPACSSDSGESTAAAPTTAAPTTTTIDLGPSEGLIAIGHSGLTGENSDPDEPGDPARENSWATGTNPDVDSIYQRMIEIRPETEDHVANTAVGGAPASDLPNQARAALDRVANPALVIIQTIDGDIKCDGRDEQDHIPAFGEDVAEVLDLVTERAPEAVIFMSGQWGRPRREYIETVVAEVPGAREFLMGPPPCSVYDEDGNFSEENLASLTAIIEGFEAEMARVCAEYEQCHTDEGVTATHQDSLDLFSSDFEHLNVAGLAAVAELIWPTIEPLVQRS